jgi:hypothetical protein
MFFPAYVVVIDLNFSGNYCITPMSCRVIIRDVVGDKSNKFISTIREKMKQAKWGIEYEELYPDSDIKIPVRDGRITKETCDVFILFVNDDISDQIEPNETHKRFSWTFYAEEDCPAVILFNEYNWRNAHDALGISVDTYRTYVIWHELGHAHGLRHVELEDIKTKQLPVMFQMTNQEKSVIDKFDVVGEPMKFET